MGKSSGKSDPDLERWIKWLTTPFTKEEKQDRIDFYSKSEIELKFSDKLIEYK